MKMMLLNTKPVIKKIITTGNSLKLFFLSLLSLIGNIIKRICFRIVNHNLFEWVVFSMIILNTLTLTLLWY